MQQKAKLVLALMALGSSAMVWANDEVLGLETIVVTADSEQTESNLLGTHPNVSDRVIDGKAFKQKSATLGDALAGELGIHSNQYGGGASAPIIRGQEGKRIKILQNNSDVVDMSTMSPDHAVAVDTTLAKHVEIVRGATTLLYSSGNAAGVVNVIDHKIPTTMPEGNIEGDLGFRFNTNSNEKLTTGGLTLGLGSNIALRVEGLDRQAGNYQTPNYQYGHYASQADFNQRQLTYETLDHVPESWAKSQSGSLGLSWIHDKGSLGAAYTHRQDKYGLPAHNHIYDGCYVRIVEESMKQQNPHLFPYPELAESHQVFWTNPGVIMKDCHTHTTEGSPYIDLVSKRYDLRGQLNQPFIGIDKVRASASYVDYQHSEKEGAEASNIFNNKGITARLEFTHQPIGNLTGVWGIQYLQQKNSALSPEDSHQTHQHRATQQLLNNNTMNNWSVFGLERYQWNDVLFELSTRIEKQKVSKQYDHNKVREEYLSVGLLDEKRPETANVMDTYYALTKPHKETAYSFASGVHWEFLPNHKLSFNVSHQERLPNAQELYAHGMHLATNSFEMGNKDLTKEKSNNFELGFSYQGDQLDYRVSGYLYNFDNYIYLYTMNANPNSANAMKTNRDLRVNRYMQAPAHFYGLEANIGYQLTPIYHMSLFGDYVRGRLKSHDIRVNDKEYYITNPAFTEAAKQVEAEGKVARWRIRSYVRNTLGIEPDIKVTEPVYQHQAEMYTPRLPPTRLGTRIKADFDDHFKGDLEYYHVFKQNNISKFETPTKGHHMLNLGLSYQNQLAKGQYDLFFKANNILDQEVYAHESFLPYIPQMGRNFSLGVNYKF